MTQIISERKDIEPIEEISHLYAVAKELRSLI
jgi:hypothetical protein